jgi:predicted  nucleic acid-binding Zn-ribbon protein
MTTRSLITRSGETAALLQLAALDARIRQADRTSLEIARQVNKHRLGIETLTRFLDGDRARLAQLGLRDERRSRIERAIEARQGEIARLAEELDVDRRRAEPTLERVRETIRAARDEREKILQLLDGALVAHYQSLIHRGELSFIVMVRDGCCAGCAFRFPPALMEELQRLEAIVTCPRCERMVYGRGLDA